MAGLMRAVGVAAAAGELQPLEIAVPEPGDGEVLVRVRASSINPIDVYVARGSYAAAPVTYPLVPGWDFAGVVERGTDLAASGLSVGDEVMGFLSRPVFGDGAWAEYVCVSTAGAVVRKPAGVSFETAAVVPLAAVTALMALDAVQPAAGEVVLVVGAGGAVGGYAVQLAARAGAHVIATGKEPEQARLRSLRAAEILDYTRLDLADAVRAAHPEGIDVLVDLVTDRDAIDPLTALVRDGGRVASARYAAHVKALAERGIAAANVRADRCDPPLLRRVCDLLERGELTPQLARTCELEELPAVMDEFARGGAGKIAVRVS